MSKTLEERFWEKVDVTKGCWNWTSSKEKDGYGQFRLPSGRRVQAHRFSWELTNGEIPDRVFVCHHCDNPSCVRPDHLFLGTHDENMRDRNIKGRAARGEKHGRARLSDEEIELIREAYAEGGVSYSVLGERFGISRQHVGAVVRGERRNDV